MTVDFCKLGRRLTRFVTLRFGLMPAVGSSITSKITAFPLSDSRKSYSSCLARH